MVEETEKKGGVWIIPRSPTAVLFQGIGVLALGVVLVGWPGATLRVVAIAFGAFALFFGLIQVYDAFSETHENKWWRIPLAIVAIAAGLIALFWRDATERVILVIIGLWFIITGFLMMVGGLKLPKDTSGRWLIVVVAVVALGFGVYLLVRPADTTPQEAASIVVRIIGIFAIVEGLLLAFYSFLLRRAAKMAEPGE